MIELNYKVIQPNNGAQNFLEVVIPSKTNTCLQHKDFFIMAQSVNIFIKKYELNNEENERGTQIMGGDITVWSARL